MHKGVTRDFPNEPAVNATHHPPAPADQVHTTRKSTTYFTAYMERSDVVPQLSVSLVGTENLILFHEPATLHFAQFHASTSDANLNQRPATSPLNSPSSRLLLDFDRSAPLKVHPIYESPQAPFGCWAGDSNHVNRPLPPALQLDGVTGESLTAPSRGNTATRGVFLACASGSYSQQPDESQHRLSSAALAHTYSPSSS